MVLDLGFVLHSQPLLGVLVQELSQQVLGYGRDVVGNLKLLILNVFIQFSDILGVIGRESHQQFVEHCTHLVDVCGLAHTSVDEQRTTHAARAGEPDSSSRSA